MLPIPEVSEDDFSLSTSGPLPAWDDIPEAFRTRQGRNPWCRIFDTLFFSGGSLASVGLTPKEGVDLQAAMRAIKACMDSFKSKHEHKTAGVAYMLSEWFDRAEDTNDHQ